VRLILLAASLALAGCDGGVAERTDVSSTGVVHRSAAEPPAGSVPRGSAAEARALAAGAEATPELLSRGREAYAIFCAACHGARGQGDGPVVARGYPRPPPIGRSGAPAAARVVAIVTDGQGVMRPMDSIVPIADRWAIAHHLRALAVEGGR
jgi:mono/diheme cytochrome c family protein